MRAILMLATTALFAAAAGAARTDAVAGVRGLEILKHAIASRSVAGAGNTTPALAAYLKQQLVAGGFPPDDIGVTPLGDTAYLAARYRGTDRALPPLILSGHMDVVEAKPADWKRDPFTPVIENGYIYGRGATDMKFSVAMMIATLIDLRQAGYRPKRDILLVLSGDEETAMKTTRALAADLTPGAIVLNGDGGGGQLGEDGKPQYFALEGAEKTYADYVLEVTDPGGHSSQPRAGNAIYRLAHAMERIEAYRFPTQASELTRAFFRAAANRETPAKAAAMRAFAADPTDTKAVATLADDPAYVGKIGTTCVATMLNAGHAQNALPQRATANVNCRIFPGTSIAAVRAALVAAVGDPKVAIRYDDAGSVASDASPMRPDVTAAVRAALDGAGYRGVPIVPTMAAGASDSMYFRNRGLPSYGVSPVFIKPSDDFSHGLNERTPIANIGPSIRFWRTIITRLSN